MNEELEIRLMELLVKLGYSREFIIKALMHASCGMGVGCSLSASGIELRREVMSKVDSNEQ